MNLLAITLVALAPQSAERTDLDTTRGVVPALYDALGDEVRKFDEHVTFLANPFMRGRLPGSPEMRITEDYVEQHFIAYGLEPAFEGSYRQAVALRPDRSITRQSLSFGEVDGVADADFAISLAGTGGAVRGELVFAGYGIPRDQAPEDVGYASFADPDAPELDGKIAVVFRFEPMDGEGRTQWGSNGRWTRASSYTTKMRAAEQEGAAAILLVNPPGVDDERRDELPIARGSRQWVDIPVGAISADLFAQMLRAAGAPDAGTLRQRSDEAGFVLPLGIEAALTAELEVEQTYSDNIGGLLPGRGALADEVVVVGGHIDHLGMGVYGSRGYAGELHPGADDNASGTAAVIMLAERLVPWMNALPQDAEARSILFLGLNAEESGLNGARHYVANPIRPIEQHTLMVNFDMIGRIVDRRVQILGSQTGEGLREWLAELDAESPLELNAHDRLNLGSDHLLFMGRGVPVLFAIVDPLHEDYHRPTDTADKINRVDAVHCIDLFEAVLQGASLRPERHVFVEPPQRGRR